MTMKELLWNTHELSLVSSRRSWSWADIYRVEKLSCPFFKSIDNISWTTVLGKLKAMRLSKRGPRGGFDGFMNDGIVSNACSSLKVEELGSVTEALRLRRVFSKHSESMSSEGELAATALLAINQRIKAAEAQQKTGQLPFVAIFTALRMILRLAVTPSNGDA
jgi:hypothetical protein